MTATPTHTVREAVIHLAWAFDEAAGSTAFCFTCEANGQLIDGEFRVMQRMKHAYRGLLNILRAAIDVIPAGTTRVTIICAFSNLIHVGSGGRLPTSYRRFWRSILQHLSTFEVTWKLAGESDARQLALIRCLHSLLADRSLASPPLIALSRRARKAARRQQDASTSHTHILPRLNASAA